ncbi:MAG: tRNA lysidine(34) synthetase TilS [Clostridiaceae bacterium]|nr:tRNA lysidine(34) synthetase TilS [Clostridiaceae bacterium]
MDIHDRFEETIAKHNMIDKGVIACVSGGADSICMLYLLYDYCSKHDVDLVCAHFNHCIRGEESDSDMEFVKDVCKKLGIKLYFESGDVPSLAKKLSKGIEETARIARYEFFEKLAKETGYRICVAHNRDDRIETVIHNIFRGTSIDGLKGIPYTRGNIIRPMLDIGRKEIEEFLSQNNIEFKVDSTNADVTYIRNRIRHKIIPFLENEYGSIKESIIRLSDLSIEDSDFLNSVASEKALECIIPDSYVKIDISRYSKNHVAIRGRILKIALGMLLDEEGKRLFEAGKGIEMSIIKRVDAFALYGHSGKSVDVSKGVVARKEYDTLVFVFDEYNHLSKSDCCLTFEIVPYSSFDKSLLNDLGCACFDYDKLLEEVNIEELKVRTRKEGDVFTPFGFSGTKKLKKFLIDEKIPVSERNRIMLLAHGKCILWIPNIRRSNMAPIDKNTQNVIIFRLHYKKWRKTNEQ